MRAERTEEGGAIAARGNWGRWGAEDERGTLNLLTPDLVLEAARSVRTGRRAGRARRRAGLRLPAPPAAHDALAVEAIPLPEGALVPHVRLLVDREFLLVVAPLLVTGATASPANPIAIG